MRFNASGWITTKTKAYKKAQGGERLYTYTVYSYRAGGKERCIRLHGNQEAIVSEALSDRKSVQEIKELLSKSQSKNATQARP